MENALKLSIEMVPSTLWHLNWRGMIRTVEWDKIRKSVYAASGHKCAICGDDGKLNCHETWDFDASNSMVRLVGFIALCNPCYFAKHLGFARMLAARGKVHLESVVEHFLKVNGCDLPAFKECVHGVGKVWSKRSKIDWRMDLGEYAALVRR